MSKCKWLSSVLVLAICMLALAGCQTAPPQLNDGVGDRFQLPSRSPVFASVGPSLAAPKSAGLTGAVGPPAAPDEARQSSDLWVRLRGGFALTQAAQPSQLPEPLTDTVLALRVDGHVRWYQQNQANLERTFTRARLVLFDIVEALERAGLPLELALVPAVESAFQPDVCSRAAACGLWQFIMPTARRFDLKRHLFADERRHIRAGTGAGLAGRFTDLQLPNETAQYVPRILALAQVVANPDANGLSLPAIDNKPYFVAHRMTRDVDVAVAARLSGVRVHTHSSAEAIARVHGADLAQFRVVNGIQPVHKVQAGSTVLVPRRDHEITADIPLDMVLNGILNLNTAVTRPRVNRRRRG